MATEMATPARDQQVESSVSGYDFNYIDHPPDKLVCKICQLPCREAQRSKCCGNVFCKRDLEKTTYRVLHAVFSLLRHTLIVH